MPEQLVPMQGCPVPACDDEPERTIVTTKPTKLTMQNITHERVCIYPRMHQFDSDSEPVPVVYVAFHGELEPIEIEEPEPERPEPEDPDNPTEEEIQEAIDHTRDGDGEYDEEIADAMENAREAPDPDELTGDLAVLYDRVVELETSEDSAVLGVLKGKMLDADVPPGEVAELADKLVERGYIVEIDDAVYKTASA